MQLSDGTLPLTLRLSGDEDSDDCGQVVMLMVATLGMMATGWL